MIRRSRPLFGAPLAIALLLGLASCGGDDGPGTTGPDVPQPTTIVITQSSASLTFLGATFNLTATVRDQNGSAITATLSWSSSDPNVVTVSSAGVLTAVGNGTATITASASGLTATVPVTVEQVATALAIVSGGGQTATVGQALTDPVVVRADDAGGAPVEGADLTFAVTSGEGSLTAESATTGTGGVASTGWTLGTISGLQEIQAALVGSGPATLQITATATAGAPASLEKESGDQQVGPIDLALGEPVVATVLDQFANGVPGVSVSFVVTSGGGSVNPVTATTDEFGSASATWTMGSTLGAATLTAAATGLTPVEFSATATGAPLPVAELVAGAIIVDPIAPTSLETMTITVPVTNTGNTTTGVAVPVTLSIDGAEVSTVNIGPIGAGFTANAVFTAGPLQGGIRALSVDVDPGDVVAENDETNNSSVLSLAVVAQNTLVAGTPISNVGAGQGVELLFAFELAAEDGSIEFNLSGGSGDADMYVHRGERPATRDDYECLSGAADSNESCRFNAAQTGTYHVLIHAFSTFSGTTLSVTTGLEVLPYNLELSFINQGTSSQNAAFTQAATEWESILPYDITDIPFANQVIAANTCIQGQPAISETVDDIRIYVDLIAIDGPGGTLGQAGPCIIRTATGLPIIGFMQFDTDDLASLETNGELGPVILHEMGHVLGIGTTWARAELIKNPSANNAGADTHFAGPLAIEAFNAAGGTNYTGGAKVPVENTGEQGSADGHWRESVLFTELMTPFLNTGSDPLSAISIQSLADVGYRVDVTKADPFTGNFSTPAPAPGADGRRVVDLRGDIWRGPILEVDSQGKVVKVIPGEGSRR